MTRTTTLNQRRLGIAAAILALFALLGAACRPVQPPGAEPWNPTGNLEIVAGGNGEVRVAGWASQWAPYGDTQTYQRHAQIVVMVNGEWVPGVVVEANKLRSDVHRYLGTRMLGPIQQSDMGYGFDFTVPAPKGEATVCVAALNLFMGFWTDVRAPADHVLLGCRTVTVS